MAFSAQPDHGQTDRKDGVFSGIRKAIPREKTKFVPNPAAKPFVPSSNFEVTRSNINKTWTNSRGQGSHAQVQVFGDNGGLIRTGPLTISTSLPLYGNGSILNGNPNGLISNSSILQHQVPNGVVTEEPLTPTTPQRGKHIALHLLSKVLDDETIFNFTSIDECGANHEPFSPLAMSVPNGQGFDGTAHSWPTAASYPQPAPGANMPGIVTNFGSFPGQNIWSNESNPSTTPPLSPIEISPSSSYGKVHDATANFLKHSSRPTSLPTYERHSPMVNGYTEDHSPYPSPTGQSYGSSDASPHHSFLPIQEPYTNGRSQQSCESGYYSNSNNGSCYGVPASPSSMMGYMPSPPEVHTFILPLSGTGSQYSSPSMSPSSPPITHISKQVMPSPDAESASSPKILPRGSMDRSFPSPSPRDCRENGFITHGIPQRKSPLMSELHMRLDKCYEQLRLLERERKQTETEISHLWSGRRLSNSNNGPNLRLPANPSRVDKMVVDQLREHSKVEALVSRIERIRHSPLHVSISEAVDLWQQSIRELKTRRQDEVRNVSNGSSVGRSRLCTTSRYHADATDLQALVQAVKELTAQTRLARTTCWCASQLVTADTLSRTGSFTDSDGSSVSPADGPRALEGTGEVS